MSGSNPAGDAARELLTRPLGDLAGALEREAVSPVALVEATLERIASLDDRLNCYITLMAEAALEAAEASADRRRAGRALGPLDGVPVAVKDLLDVAGAPTTNGMACHRDNVADADAETVRRLRAAGAVLVGKLNMHEAAVGATNDNPAFGRCHNPWRHGHSPGGSSGGSAAAVAAGLCAGALGTDNMGSVRIPAALCGIAGLKPTAGLVSTRGMVQLSYSTAAIGPMARGVTGLAMMMEVLAGFDPECEEARPAPTALDFRLPDAVSLEGVRLGVLPELLPERHVPSVRAAFEAALGTLTAAGATVHPVALAELDAARRECLLIIEAEGAVAMETLLAREPPPFSADVLPLLRYGQKMTASRLVKALRHRARLRHEALRRLEEVDALVTPTCPVPAYRFDDGAPDDVSVNLALANLGGLPALSVPMGFSDDGLPLGLQIMAAPFADPRVLEIGKAFEAATAWHLETPPLAAGG